MSSRLSQESRNERSRGMTTPARKAPKRAWMPMTSVVQRGGEERRARKPATTSALAARGSRDQAVDAGPDDEEHEHDEAEREDDGRQSGGPGLRAWRSDDHGQQAPRRDVVDRGAGDGGHSERGAAAGRAFDERLIVGVVALAAVGLLVAGGVTYAVQRDFQFGRVDEQARSALPLVANELEDKGVVADASGPGDPRRGGGRPGEARPERRPRPGGNLPSAVYGEARSAAGTRLGSVTPGLALGETAPAAPDLPDDITPDEAITVGATGSDDRATARSPNAPPTAG